MSEPTDAQFIEMVGEMVSAKTKQDILDRLPILLGLVPSPTEALSVEQVKVIIYDAMKDQFPTEGAAMMIASCCAEPIRRALLR